LLLLPATVRIYARGGNPDTDYAVPRRWDALLLVGATTLLSTFAAGYLGVSETGFAVVALASSAVVVSVGGHKVAELWGTLVLHGLAG